MGKTSHCFREVDHEADFCVVGGGMAGLVAAIAAARHGARVVLIQDRPVLGGNASSETRVHICGADRHNGIKNLRETGILEEIRLENLYRNPQRSFGVWDTILYEKARYQENLALILNCSVLQAEMDGKRIVSVTGWQLTTQTYHKVRAKIFADCSGDGILAPLTGAEFRVGREARGEFGESLAPEQTDRRTMGMSILIATREHARPQPFEPPHWAYRFETCQEIPYGEGGHNFWGMGYWWVELGGEHDSIRDTETMRDELLRIAYGVWDHTKNHCKHRDAAANWAIDWVQFLPAKRESRRYVGDHVLSQVDIDSEGRFDDLVAYGGWTMDDHDPAGFWAVKHGRPATQFHKTPSPYGIPYRCLYSRNIDNLMFAGRCHSATHMAMSSTRVMGTGCSMGQAVGTAAAMAVKLGLDPRGILPSVKELQQVLLRDDCYLPWVKQEFGPLTRGAEVLTSNGDGETLRDGTNRPVGDDPHAWEGRAGDYVGYTFARPEKIPELTLILDSNLEMDPQMSHFRKADQLTSTPPAMPKAFHVDAMVDDKWSTICEVQGNHQRLVRLAIGKQVEAVRFVLDRTWGAETSRVYAMYVD